MSQILKRLWEGESSSQISYNSQSGSDVKPRKKTDFGPFTLLKVYTSMCDSGAWYETPQTFFKYIFKFPKFFHLCSYDLTLKPLTLKTALILLGKFCILNEAANNTFLLNPMIIKYRAWKRYWWREFFAQKVTFLKIKRSPGTFAALRLVSSACQGQKSALKGHRFFCMLINN